MELDNMKKEEEEIHHLYKQQTVKRGITLNADRQMLQTTGAVTNCVQSDGRQSLKPLQYSTSKQLTSQKVELVINPLCGKKQKAKWSNLLILLGYASTLGSAVPVGYCIGVINSPAKLVKSWCNETLIERYNIHITLIGLELLWSSIVSIFLIGGAMGSLGGAWAANRIGRKGCFLLSGLLFLIGALLFYFCRLLYSVEMLLVGRLIVGLASGLTTATLPMYLSECAPLNLRGTLGVFPSVGVTGGVVVGQIFSLRYVFGTDELWHCAFSFYIILVLICYVPSYYYPESPKYLYIIKGKYERTQQELIRLRSDGSRRFSGANNDLIKSEIDEMDFQMNRKTTESTFSSVLKDRTYMLPLLIVCCFHGGQQLSGINAISYYSVSIFEKAGLSPADAEWANLGAGILNLATSFLSPILMAKMNRRSLMLLSTSICSGVLLAIAFILNYIETLSWLPTACIVCIMAYIFIYQLGLGPIPYFIGSELFEVAPRPVAMAMGSLASWSCNFIIGMTFLTLARAWGAFIFLPFSISCALLFAFSKFYLPETRDRDPSEVARLVSKGFRSNVFKTDSGTNVTQSMVKSNDDELEDMLEELDAAKKPFIFFVLNDYESKSVTGRKRWSLLILSRPEQTFFYFNNNNNSNNGNNSQMPHQFIQRIKDALNCQNCPAKQIRCTQQVNSYDWGILIICMTDNVADHINRFECVDGMGPLHQDTISGKRSDLLKLIQTLGGKI